MANWSRCSTTLTLEPLTKSLREFGRPSVPSRSNSATAAQLGPIVPESLRRPDPIASETLSAGRNHGSGSPRRRKGRGTQPTPSCWPAPRFSCDRDGWLRRASDARLTPAPRRVALTLRGAASLQLAPWSLLVLTLFGNPTPNWSEQPGFSSLVIFRTDLDVHDVQAAEQALPNGRARAGGRVGRQSSDREKWPDGNDGPM